MYFEREKNNRKSISYAISAKFKISNNAQLATDNEHREYTRVIFSTGSGYCFFMFSPLYRQNDCQQVIAPISTNILNWKMELPLILSAWEKWQLKISIHRKFQLVPCTRCQTHLGYDDPKESKSYWRRKSWIPNDCRDTCESIQSTDLIVGRWDKLLQPPDWIIRAVVQNWKYLFFSVYANERG